MKGLMMNAHYWVKKILEKAKRDRAHMGDILVQGFQECMDHVEEEFQDLVENLLLEKTELTRAGVRARDALYQMRSEVGDAGFNVTYPFLREALEVLERALSEKEQDCAETP